MKEGCGTEAVTAMWHNQWFNRSRALLSNYYLNGTQLFQKMHKKHEFLIPEIWGTGETQA